MFEFAADAGAFLLPGLAPGLESRLLDGLVWPTESRLVREKPQRREVGVTLLREDAAQIGLIHAGRVRLCELSPERCCAVFSKNGVIEWVAPSPTWTRTIVEGQYVHRDTLAWDPFARRKLDDRAQPIPACAWFDAPDGIDIIEHATWRPEYGTVLSMLWAPEAVATDGPRER